MSGDALQNYIKEIEKDFKRGIATEHTYRGTLKALLEALRSDITATNEPKRVKCGAPDYVIEKDNLTIGYIEAKDIGVPLDKIEKDEQLKRYRNALGNLILTDYLEFRWYVDGEKRMTATLATSGKDKSLLLDKTGLQQTEELLTCFLEHSAEPVRKPRELAKRMARLAHMTRDIIVGAFKQKEASDNLKDLYTAFQQVLLPELTESEFADMFAQTLVYGLFAARYNHTGRKPFSRSDAAKEIPRTNPFLRRLFGSVAGSDLDDEPFVGFVDELAQLLAYTDMEAVLADFGKHTRAEDPIVHFYETFLSQYDPKLRELRGVYYTPDPVVSYIVRSVDALLRTHFDCPDGLADTGTMTYSYTDEEGKEHTAQTPRVLILDPATGTATFLYHVIAHIRETYRRMGNAGMWSSYVREHLLPRLFGFELLIAPYAMAHLKLGMQLAAADLPKEEQKTWAYDFQSNERLGIYLTNTLDEAQKRSEVLFGRYISDEANEAAKVKQGYPVMVVLGNPPYSGHSANKGQWIKDLLHGIDAQTGRRTENYFEVDGKPLDERNPKWLNDDYVKFIRFAQWRIEKTGYGILAFITNHRYLDNPTFRGMRQSLMQSFDEIYILDLHGNSKKKERPPNGSHDENVFDIQQGVAISIFVRRNQHNVNQPATVRHIELWGPREHFAGTGKEKQLIGGKYHWLIEHDITNTEWATLKPEAPFYLFVPQNIDVRAEYEQGWKVKDIFPLGSIGIATARDALTIQFSQKEIWRTITDFAALSSEEARSKYNLGKDTRDWQVVLAQKDIHSTGPSMDKLVPILYRPFDTRYTYYSGNSRGFHCMPRKEVMSHMLAGKNLALATTRSIEIGRGWEHVFCANELIQLHTVSLKEVNYLFPLYLYLGTSNNNTLFDIDLSIIIHNGHYLNLAPAFVQQFSGKLGLQFVLDGKGDLQQTLGPEDIFSYMYAVFYSPTYRERYAEFLKIDFPRLPLTSNADLFRELCKLGSRLVELHLMEKSAKITTRFPESGNNVVEKVSYSADQREPEKGRVGINKTQYFEGVSPDVWEFHIGGYQVCEKWLKDRKGRALSFSDIQHYQHIVAALTETITLMEQIDKTIEKYGGWPFG
jgi:predicted helicase